MSQDKINGRPAVDEQLVPECSTTYEIKNKTFLVESVFRQEGEETLGTALMRLMKDDCSGNG